MLSRLCPQWDGICRPPDAGSSLAPDRREEHFERREAERQAERAIAVVREEPVVAATEMLSGCDEDSLVAGAADLKEGLDSDF